MTMNRRKIKVDFFWASCSHFVSKLVGFLVIIILTRYLDKSKMGEFFFAASLSSFFAIFTELGTNQYLIREVSEKPNDAIRHLSDIVSIRLPIQGVVFLLLSAFTIIFKSSIFKTVCLTSIYIFLEELYFSFGAFFLGLKKVYHRAVTLISAKLLLASLILLVIKKNASLTTILICYNFANFFLVGIAFYLVWKKYGPFRLNIKWDEGRRIIKNSLPFFILSVLALVHFKFDTIMLGFMRPYSAVATYEAGFKLLEVSQFVIRPVRMVFFPIIVGLAANQNWEQIKSLFKKTLWITGSFGVIITAVVLTSAELIVTLVFGVNYDKTAVVIEILFLSAPILYMGFVSIFFASALHIEKMAGWIMLVGVVSNIILNAIGIPWLGVIGAAWASVISQTIITVWLIRLTVKTLQTNRDKNNFTALPILGNNE